MLKLVIAGHGDLPEALCASARMIGVNVDGVRTLSLHPGEALLSFVERLTGAVDDGPTLILTDLRGGTPDNAAQLMARRNPSTVTVVSNMNLPLLLEVIEMEELDHAELGELTSLAAPVTSRAPANH